VLELAAIVVLGILAQWMAWRFRVPAILPLVIFGLLLGPLSVYWTYDQKVWLQIRYNPDTDQGIFPGKYLFHFVSFALSLILFEGSLGLRLRDLGRERNAIWGLLSVGVCLTFLGVTWAANACLGLDWPLALLFSALVVVTGPTVILPILQSTSLNRRVGLALKWESLLISPIGALLAVLSYQYIIGTMEQKDPTILRSFLQIVITGLLFGAAFAQLAHTLLENKRIPIQLVGPFHLALVGFVLVLTNTLVPDSGLLSVVVMGVVLANLESSRLGDGLRFLEPLSTLLIAALFIIMSANIRLSDLQKVFYNPGIWVLLLLIIFVIRPLVVFCCTGWWSGLNFREKLFLGLIGPRGIVAASMATVIGAYLVSKQVPSAGLIVPLVFVVELGTVFFAGIFVVPLAKLLKVERKGEGYLIIGANMVARVFAQYLLQKGQQVTLIDSNEETVGIAQQEGLQVIHANVNELDSLAGNQLQDTGYLLAMTANREVNLVAVDRYQAKYGPKGSFRLAKKDELNKPASENANGQFLNIYADFAELLQRSNESPAIQELHFGSIAELDYRLPELQAKGGIPIFISDANGQICLLDLPPKELPLAKGPLTLAYLGPQFESF
jgi:NhaP-type Na+/H+ or K+/H+ antiporter